ncbi:MAG: helix-turn-helix domain-containing protein [Micavibrio sp.]
MNDNTPIIRKPSRPASTLDRGLTLHETAEILGYCYTTVYRMAKNGDLETYGSGKKLRVYESSIERYRQQTRNNLKGLPTVRERVRVTGTRYRQAMNDLEGLLR